MRYWRLVGRAIRLRCPVCGVGKIFRGWFSMHPECQNCGASLEREPGFFLGAIYFNYGLTAVVATAAYLTLVFAFGYPSQRVMFGVLGFCLLFPIAYFRHARALWLAFDEFFDPRQAKTSQKSKTREAGQKTPL